MDRFVSIRAYSSPKRTHGVSIVRTCIAGGDYTLAYDGNPATAAPGLDLVYSALPNMPHQRFKKTQVGLGR